MVVSCFPRIWSQCYPCSRLQLSPETRNLSLSVPGWSNVWALLAHFNFCSTDWFLWNLLPMEVASTSYFNFLQSVKTNNFESLNHRNGCYIFTNDSTHLASEISYTFKVQRQDYWQFAITQFPIITVILWKILNHFPFCNIHKLYHTFCFKMYAVHIIKQVTDISGRSTII